MRSRPWRPVLVSCCLAIGLGVSQDTAGEVASELSLGRILVEPERPAEETLCKLSIEVSNSSEGAASYLAFEVRLNGEPLAVYENQLFVQQIAPQSSTTVDLFNFWSTDSDRLPPTDGKITIEVLLLEAQWARIEIENGVEIWTPTGSVAGLPVSSRRTLHLP